MRLALDHHAPRQDPWVQAVLGAMVVGAFAAAAFFPFLRLPSLCAFKNLTGHPCMACGMTRSWIHAVHGQLGDAITQNPLGTALFFGAAVTVLYQGARRWGMPAIRVQAAAWEGRALRALILGIVLSNWAYVWISGVA